MVDAYFYSCCNRNGKIKKMRGWVLYENSTNPGEKAKFLTRSKRRYTCAATPGTVFKDSVWLLRENDQKAVELIQKHRMSEIRKLEDLLKTRYMVYHNISMMEEGD